METREVEISPPDPAPALLMAKYLGISAWIAQAVTKGDLPLEVFSLVARLTPEGNSLATKGQKTSHTKSRISTISVPGNIFPGSVIVLSLTFPGKTKTR